MRSVSIVGIGQSPVGEHWDRSIRTIAYDAVTAAMQDANIEAADALFVGNMLSGSLVDQEHLATLVADTCGLYGIEATKIEAACASASAALRVGTMAVASGMHDVVIVAGLEKMTDTVGKSTTAGLATAADAESETLHGVSFVGLNALIMQRYMYEHDVPLDAFAGFSMNAHKNGANNPNAMFQRAINLETYQNAPTIATPINIMDSSPVCDGAAAVVLVPTDQVGRFTTGSHRGAVKILSSASANDTLAVHDRRDPLFLEAAYISSQKAYNAAGLTHEDIDIFELHDAFSIMSALSLEATGFAQRGQGWRMADEGQIGIGGELPISTMGGAKIGMAQNIGGSGATIVTHILGV